MCVCVRARAVFYVAFNTLSVISRRWLRVAMRCDSVRFYVMHWCTVSQTQDTITQPNHIILAPGQPILVYPLNAERLAREVRTGSNPLNIKIRHIPRPSLWSFSKFWLEKKTFLAPKLIFLLRILSYSDTHSEIKTECGEFKPSTYTRPTYCDGIVNWWLYIHVVLSLNFGQVQIGYFFLITS